MLSPVLCAGRSQVAGKGVLSARGQGGGKAAKLAVKTEVQGQKEPPRVGAGVPDIT